MRKLLKGIIYICLIVVALGVSINVGIIIYGNNWIIDPVENEEEFTYGMILGASVKADGTLSEVLQSRVDAAVDAYSRGLIEKIFISGDDQEYYKEVTSIRAYLVAQGVATEHIQFDAIGRNTYLSMWRAKEIYGIEKLLIFTQQYHLSRSIYIARSLQIDAHGYIVDRQADVSTKQHVREFFARIKACIEVVIKHSIDIDEDMISVFR